MQAISEKTDEMKVGKRYKLIVRSAEEAVRIIRENLGSKGSFRSSVGGEGLKRFISSPKLEVIAGFQVLKLRNQKLMEKNYKWRFYSTDTSGDNEGIKSSAIKQEATKPKEEKTNTKLGSENEFSSLTKMKPCPYFTNWI